MKKRILSLLILALAVSFSHPAQAASRKPKIFEIHLSVDFGPANQKGVDQKLEVEKGMTAQDAAALVYPVQFGKSCCSLRELFAINGVKVEASKSHWWICLLNGSKNFSPRKYKLKPGDKIEWKYIHEERCPLGQRK